MKTISINLSDMAQWHIEKFTMAAENLQNITVTKKDLEEARSYAVEALTDLLYENPHIWRYKDTLKEIAKKKKPENKNP